MSQVVSLVPDAKLDPNKNYIFVYGTLLSGMKRRKALERYHKIKVISKASIARYALHQDPNKSFPFMIWTGLKSDIVRGEIIEVDDTAKKDIQSIESDYVEKSMAITIDETIGYEKNSIIVSYYVFEYEKFQDEKKKYSRWFSELIRITKNYRLYCSQFIKSNLV